MNRNMIHVSQQVFVENEFCQTNSIFFDQSKMPVDKGNLIYFDFCEVSEFDFCEVSTLFCLKQNRLYKTNMVCVKSGAG